MSDSLKSDYQLCEEIARGKFGTVYRYFSPATTQSFACKTIKKSLLPDPTYRDCLEKEPKILQLFTGAANILRLFKIYEDEDHLHLITELCDGDDLYERVLQGPLSEPAAAAVFRQLMSAISCCHHAGIAHRDVKPNKVLFDVQGNIKLADFGSVEWFGGRDGGRMSTGSLVSFASARLLSQVSVSSVGAQMAFTNFVVVEISFEPESAPPLSEPGMPLITKMCKNANPHYIFQILSAKPLTDITNNLQGDDLSIK